MPRRSKGLLFAMPWIIGITVFALYPFVASLYYSLTNFSVLREPVFVGLDNYRAMVADSLFWKVLWNTLALSALCIFFGVFISLGLALLMNAVQIGQTIYSSIYYIPHLIPPTVGAIVWMWILNPQYGLINSAMTPAFDAFNGLSKTHLSPPDLMTNWPLTSLLLVVTWGIGQTAFIYLAKLQDVPEELYEAAEIDGASIWQKIRYVTLPTISPIILFNVIMSIIGTFQLFTEPYLIYPTGASERAAYLMPHYIYDNAFNFMRMGYACALALILFVIVVLLTALAFRVARSRVHYAGQ